MFGPQRLFTYRRTHNRNEERVEGGEVQLCDVLCATSAIFSPLSCPSTRRRIINTFPILMLLPKVPAPLINGVPYGDGAFYDFYGIHGALAHLPMCRMTIVIISRRRIDPTIFWKGRKGILFPNTPSFTGSMPHPSWRSKRGVFRAALYTSCETTTKRIVNVIFVGGNTELPSMPKKKNSWRTKLQDLGVLIDELPVYNRRLAVCFSGGGWASALITTVALEHLEARQIPLDVVSACSGGAWGVALHAKGATIDSWIHDTETRVDTFRTLRFNHSIYNLHAALRFLDRKCDWNALVKDLVGDVEWKHLKSNTRYVFNAVPL